MDKYEQAYQTFCPLIERCFREKYVQCDDGNISLLAEHCYNLCTLLTYGSQPMIRQINRRMCILDQPALYDKNFMEKAMLTYIRTKIKTIQTKVQFVMTENTGVLLIKNYNQCIEGFVPDTLLQRLLPISYPHTSISIKSNRPFFNVFGAKTPPPFDATFTIDPSHFVPFIESIPFAIYFPQEWRDKMKEWMNEYMLNDLARICLDYCMFV